MKKIILLAVAAATLGSLSSCGTMGSASSRNTSSTGTSGDPLVGILGSVLSGGSSTGTTGTTGNTGTIGIPTTGNTGTTTQQSSGSSGLGGILGSVLGSGSSSSGNGSQSMLGSLLSDLLGSAIPVTYDNIAGTWTYQSPDCRFESENALAKAGGAVAASTVESKLADLYKKVGIAPGVCSFTFNKDQTCSLKFGSRSISGTYTIDSNTKAITIASSTGLIRLSGQVYYSGSTLSILFNADKLLSAVKMIASFTGQGSSTLSTVSSLLNNYDGMMIGMNLVK